MALETATLVEGEPQTVHAQIKRGDGTYLLQSQVQDVQLTIFEETADDASELVYTDTLNKTDVVFTSLQTGADWTRDANGYNFKHQINGRDVFAEGGRTYRAEYRIRVDNAADEYELVWLVVRIKVKGVASQ